jgi:hypothetical protein
MLQEPKYDSRLSLNASIEKGKVIPLHAMEALGARGGTAPTHS